MLKVAKETGVKGLSGLMVILKVMLKVMIH